MLPADTPWCIFTWGLRTVSRPCSGRWSVPAPGSHITAVKLHGPIIWFRFVSAPGFYPCLNPQACTGRSYGFTCLFIQFSNVFYFLYADTCYILSQPQYPGEIPIMNLRSSFYTHTPPSYDQLPRAS